MAAEPCRKTKPARRHAVDYEFFFEDLRLFGHAMVARQLAHSSGNSEKMEEMENTAVVLGFDLLEKMLRHASEEQYERVEDTIRGLPLLS